MKSVSTSMFVLLYLAATASGFTEKRKCKKGPVNAFKMITHFPKVVMAYTSSSDPSYECLTAPQVYLNEETKQATYLWNFKSCADRHTIVKQSTFEMSLGKSVDQLDFFLDGDHSELYTAYYNYTDYENCVVSILPYYGENLCILWVTKAVDDSIPLPCLAAYHATCQIGYRAYDSDFCEQCRPQGK
ncbi:uncharacterized protein LOC125946968 isoform X2 [Dermacentor silvarum]|uniref:uncharacterized protein LOC125946968 isoform X1 n=1 Tax=Dermacentor silvarum TaxID=543639 RepID=UPI002101B270|nr:uncharacterized protein LOC125946968 isoform X1 [Dermacentor silvarum]XP_049527155.1 uncharacterized protein LOC125946968 isoform X2 [Dermacentor silvarum]